GTAVFQSRSSKRTVSVCTLPGISANVHFFGLEKLAGLAIRTALRRTVIECAFTGTAWQLDGEAKNPKRASSRSQFCQNPVILCAPGSCSHLPPQVSSAVQASYSLPSP